VHFKLGANMHSAQRATSALPRTWREPSGGRPSTSLRFAHAVSPLKAGRRTRWDAPAPESKDACPKTEIRPICPCPALRAGGLYDAKSAKMWRV
jgi:hypothetical protein